MYNVCMIGMGPVGTVSGLCIAKSGFRVVGVDINPVRVQAFARGEAPFMEPQVNELLKECQERELFSVTDDATHAIRNSEIIMIAVGTPTPEETGIPDLSQLEAVAKTIGLAIKDITHTPIIVVRSTVPPHTMRRLLAPIISEHAGKAVGEGFHIASNPEFLREGRAIADFFHTGRVVIGADNVATFEKIAALYHQVVGEVLHVALESAEFAKYVDNTWHAVKVAYANEIARVVTAFGGNPDETARIFLKDNQLNISPYYMRPGFAFGGSCLPKDTRGILALAKQHDITLPLIAGVLPSNETHIDAGVAKVMSHRPMRVGLLGCAFKEHVDDLRESPALMVASKLMAQGVEVIAHDMAYSAGEQLALPRTTATLPLHDMESVIAQADMVVLMHNLPHYRAAVQEASKVMVDLTTIP